MIDHLDEMTAFQKEIEWIESLKSLGFSLANLSKGGEGNGKKAIVTQDFRDKIKLLVTGEKNPNYGNRWTSEQKKHLSDLRKSKGIAKFGNNPRAKKVMCVETGKVYSCQMEAAMDLGLKGMGSIHHALKKPSFVAAGYHFVASDDIEHLNTPENRQQYLSSIQSK